MSTAEKTPEALSADNISSAISKLLEHPELLSMAASALGIDSNGKAATDTPEAAEDTPTGSNGETAPSASSDVMASIMPLLSGLSGGGSFKHEPLLRALKPYLSESRKEAIDYIIKISRMSSLVKGLK